MKKESTKPTITPFAQAIACAEKSVGYLNPDEEASFVIITSKREKTSVTFSRVSCEGTNSIRILKEALIDAAMSHLSVRDIITAAAKEVEKRINIHHYKKRL